MLTAVRLAPDRPVAEIEWRRRNIGHLMFAATDFFLRQKLDIVRDGGTAAITEAQGALFQNLDADGSRLTTLATRARMTKPSMLELIDRAQASGFVQRLPDPQDRRARIVALTLAGRHMQDRLHGGVLEAERSMARVIGPDFMAKMKVVLAGYAAASPAANTCVEGGTVASGPAWRTGNIGSVLSQASGAFVRDVLQVTGRGGFSMVTDVMLALFRNLDLAGTRLTDLAARARMTKQAMRELVDRAEYLGLAARLPDACDRRAKTVAFTSTGLVMLDCFRDGVSVAQRRMTVSVGQPFVAELADRLSTYVDNDPTRMHRVV